MISILWHILVLSAKSYRQAQGFIVTLKYRCPIFHRVAVTWHTVHPNKYAHGFCFAVLCCGYTLTDFPISIRLTSLALWQSNDCPSASKATLMNMDKYFMWLHYERLHNHNKAKHNKTVCIFLGIYCRWVGLSILTPSVVSRSRILFNNQELNLFSLMLSLLIEFHYSWNSHVKCTWRIQMLRYVLCLAFFWIQRIA